MSLFKLSFRCVSLVTLKFVKVLSKLWTHLSLSMVFSNALLACIFSFDYEKFLAETGYCDKPHFPSPRPNSLTFCLICPLLFLLNCWIMYILTNSWTYVPLKTEISSPTYHLQNFIFNGIDHGFWDLTWNTSPKISLFSFKPSKLGSWVSAELPWWLADTLICGRRSSLWPRSSCWAPS